MFAAALVEAIRERWPRIRGVFWAETQANVTDLAAHSLDERLRRVLRSGIRRGDLLAEGVDPADELAERLWTDPSVRERAIRSLQMDPHAPMPVIATPADNRLLDANAETPLVLAIPASLEPLVRDDASLVQAHVVVTDVLETATALRVFPFQPGLYDFVEWTRTDQAAPV